MIEIQSALMIQNKWRSFIKVQEAIKNMMPYFLMQMKSRYNFMMLCDAVFDDEEEFSTIVAIYHTFCQRYKLTVIDHMYGDI